MDAIEETTRQEGGTDNDESCASADPRNLYEEITQEEQKQDKEEGLLLELDDLPPNERDARHTSQHFDEIDDAWKQLLATPKRSVPPRPAPVNLSMNLKQVLIGVYKKAIRYVLPKSNKFSIRPTKTKTDDELKHAVQPRSQLTTVQEHMHSMDIDDVFTIVKPVDVNTTG